MSPNSILALDFDGVVIDSILECLVTAFNAYSSHLGSGEFRTNLESFDSSEIDEFRRNRIYIRRGEDYVFLMQAAAEQVRFASQGEFDEFLDLNSGLREAYRAVFYTQRKILQEQDIESWLALNPLYPGMETFLRSQTKANQFFVVTTKDLESVQHILNSSKIPFREEKLFQATKTYGKPQILSHISHLLQVEEKNIHFVDDHPGTVMEVAEKTHARSYCASWGYNSEAQLKDLTNMKIKTLTLAEFFAEFTRG